MGAEHNFGPFTDEDDGTHIPGKTTVALKDDEAARDALANVQTGACYLLNDGTNSFFEIWNGTSWLRVSDDDHDALDGLSDDDHAAMYWLGTSTIVDAVAALDMGSNHLLLTGAPSGASRVTDHIDDIHDITAASAVKAQDIDNTKVTSGLQQHYTGTISGNGTAFIALPSGITAIISISLICTDGADGDLQLGIWGTVAYEHLVIKNTKVFSRDYSFRLRYCT